MDLKNKFIKSNSTGWFEWCKSLLELYQTKKQFIKGGEFHEASFLRLRRWVLAHEFSESNKLLQQLLLDAMVSSDNKVPGSGIYVPWSLYNDFPVIASRLGSKDYLEATLEKSFSDETKNLFECIFEAAGPLTKIVVKPSYESGFVIKYRNSYQFKLQLDKQFHKMIGHVEFIEQTNPIVIMIEGAPETIGEVNSLLEHNHQEKRPVLLIARNFPEEISATLATNWLRGSLNILPLVYGDSLDTINLAADLCSITKGELISPHFGDVISAALLDRDKWGKIDRAEWSSKGISVYKDANITSHVRNLLNKIENTDNEELKEILRERVLSLSNDAIEVWVPKEDKKTLEELDALIKHYNGFVRSGAINTELGLIPKCFADAAQENANSLKQEILKIGGFLVRAIDDNVVA